MLLIGTAGYSYEDWRGIFYPEKLNKKELLQYYAREFPFTEINTTYYRMPAASMLQKWHEQTPEHFQFVIKANKGMTHEREQNEPLFSEFREALKPLIEADKLGCVLAQFPTSFRNKDKNRDYLKQFKEWLGNIPVAVEFRHEEWIEEGVFRLLEEEEIGYVCVDEPQFKTLVPPVIRATSQIGYIRFHGRNYKKWWHHQESHERYDYLYTEEQLKEWVPKILKLAERTEKTFISMNNHYRAQAAINGRMLKELLEKRMLEAEMSMKEASKDEVILI
ncbi:DUF72 domain-containing protein [Ferviditalea candida]|uniref:DUF72 domain-containing protein n=1 Tax=Ferviditalea candida TaxID=3108399 RepID=A0ABU5ZK04_9BACL|nr:DUF72 domain-containing protein [Paenibacillaceae bacterium T2]